MTKIEIVQKKLNEMEQYDKIIKASSKLRAETMQEIRILMNDIQLKEQLEELKKDKSNVVCQKKYWFVK